MKKLTIVADHNIAHLDSYFNSHILGVESEVIAMAGRDINSVVLEQTKADALLVRSVTPVNQSLLDNNQRLQFVASATIGTDHVQEDYLADRQIHFANACGCSKHSVAQYVITAILQLQPAFAEQSITLGIIGLGNIGTALSYYGQQLGWRILAYDPFVDGKHAVMSQTGQQTLTEQKGGGVQLVSLAELLNVADVVSLHVPLTTEAQSVYPTYHLFDERAFTLMKQDSLLINSARGPVIKESALLTDIAQTGRQVVLDVFEHEPNIEAELLNQLAIATPHIAGYTLEGKVRGTQMIYQAFCDYFGLPLRQSMDRLLADNPFYWQDLLANRDRLAEFYSIMQDDTMLRQAIRPNDTGDNDISGNNTSDNDPNKHYQVHGEDFDTLRKHYPLRREWQL